MFLNRKGDTGTFWIIFGLVLSALLLIALILAFLSPGSPFGKTKTAVVKLFDVGEESIKLYKEYFGDNPSKEVIKAGLIRDFIITNLSRVGNKDCIGYLDLSAVNEEIGDYSVYFKPNNGVTEIYVYKGTVQDYNELLKRGTLAFGSIKKNLIVRVERDKEYNEFWLTDGFRRIYIIAKESSESFTQDPITKEIIPIGGLKHYSALPDKNSGVANSPHFLYKENKFIFLSSITLRDVIAVNPNPYEQLCSGK